MKRSANVWWLCGVFALGMTLAGCTDTGSQGTAGVDGADDHGHEHGHEHGHDHDHGPETLKDAVTTLTGMRDVIRDAFAANDGDAAHGPLHDIGHVLEEFEGLAEKEKVSPENAAVIKSSVEALFKHFGDVDKTMHGQEGKTYSEVSKEIDAAIVELTKACGVMAAGSEEAVAPAADKAEDKPADAASDATTDAPVSEAPAAEAEKKDE